MEKLRAQFHAPIGRLTMAFSALEDTLGWLMGELLGGDDNVRNIIASQASFGKLLNITDGLYRHRVKADDLLESWEDLTRRVSEAEQNRNRITHSTWGIWWEQGQDIYVSREKHSIRRKKGLQQAKEKASPELVTTVAEEVEKVNLDLVQLLIDTNKQGYIHTFDDYQERDNADPNKTNGR